LEVTWENLLWNCDTVASLKTFALGISTDEYVAPRNDVFHLRYALDDSKANNEEQFDALQSSLTWQANEGLSIVTSAWRAVNSMAGETWNNDPVRNAAPHSALSHWVILSNMRWGKIQ
jgi:hypothetical protein